MSLDPKTQDQEMQDALSEALFDGEDGGVPDAQDDVAATGSEAMSDCRTAENVQRAGGVSIGRPGGEMSVEKLLDKQRKKCPRCTRDALSIDPVNPLCYLSWMKTPDRIIETVNATAEPKPHGTGDKYCARTHELVPKYRKMTISELESHLLDDGNMQEFEA